MSKRHVVSFLVLILMFSFTSITWAGVEPDEIDFMPPPMPGMMMNMGYLPAQGDCSSAAASYLAPNMTVRLTESVWFGQANQVIDYYTLLSFFNQLLVETKTQAYLLAVDPGSAVGSELQKDTLGQTTGLYNCLPFEGGVAMYWQVEVDAHTGWLIESVRWENVEVPTLESDLNSFYTPNILGEMEAHFLTPHVFAPDEGLLGGTQINGNNCDGAAPTHLTLGAGANYYGSYINNSPLNDEAIETIQNAMMSYSRLNVYDTPQMPKYPTFPWSQTSLIELEDNTDLIEALLEAYQNGVPPVFPEDEEPDEDSIISGNGFLKVQIPIGQPVDVLLDGPYCTRRTEYFNEIEMQELGLDHNYVTEIYVWWRVNLSLEGADVQDVWMAESVTRLYPGAQIYHYLLMPEATLLPQPGLLRLPPDVRPILTQLDAMDSCDGLLPSRLSAGTAVQPNGSSLNMRVVPNGAVIGRIGADDRLTVLGSPNCWDGHWWWWTDRGGWVAETDHQSQLLIPAPVIVPTVIVTPEQPREPVVPVPTSTPIPTAPPRPTCDPASGANC